MPNVENLYGGGGEEEIQKKFDFIKVMILIANQAVNLINASQRVAMVLSNMTVEQYIYATTALMAWKKYDLVNEEMDNIIDRLKDDNLSSVYDTSEFESIINQILELNTKIEKIYVDKTPEEIAANKEEKKEGGKKEDDNKYAMTPAQLDRQRILQNCVKLDLRNQSLKMCVGIIALQVLIGGLIEGGQSVNHNFVKKTTLVYGRLLDIVFKIDHINVDDSGKEYLNLVELQTDKRLLEKFDVIKVIWSDVADSTVASRDWNSIMDAISRDVSTLMNDYKFKRLIKLIEEIFQDKNMSIESIYFIDRYKNHNSPWMEISKRIKEEIQNSESLKDKIEQLNAKNREIMKQNLNHENNTNRMTVTLKTLEKKLAQAQTKIEELNYIKGESEQNLKKHDTLIKQFEGLIKDLESVKKLNDDLIKKNDGLEKRASEAPSQPTSQHDENLGLYRKARQAGNLSRSSRTSTLFQELAKTSMLGGRKLDIAMTPQNLAKGGMLGGVNQVEAQRHLQAQEENYIDIINKLQTDRMKLRGRDVNDRLNTLVKKEGGLNDFIKRHTEKQEMRVKLNLEKENALTKAIENVDGLKQNIKKQMALVKVVDLKKKYEFMQKSQEMERQAVTEAKTSVFKKNLRTDPTEDSYQPDCTKTNANINYMIIQARQQVNQALETLLSGESKLSSFHIEKMKSEEFLDANRSTDEDTNSDGASSKDNNMIQIGSLKIKAGQEDNERVKTKNIVFSVKSLKSLRQNMGLFQI